MTISKGQHLIGTVLGSYTLERVLGYGGSSAVYFAQQQDSDRQVAIKVFLPRAVMDVRMQREFYRRFLREADAASKLDHPHILPIYSYGEQDGLPYIVMPYMAGGTLAEYIAQRGPLSLEEAQWYLEQVASALDYAHEQGCVHCDVKPANILLDHDGRVMLSDFGIARVTRPDNDETAPGNKSSDSLMGTPDYISPEQALGRPLDGRADVYSLGISLFYLLSKRFPFKADSTLALALLHVHEAPPSLALIRADVTPTIDRVIHKALAKEPEGRFQTAGAFIQAFAEAIASDEEERKTNSGKRARILPSIPGRIVETPYAFMPYRSVIRVKPIVTQKVSLPRLLGIVALLLLVIGSAAFAAIHFSSGNGKSIVHNRGQNPMSINIGSAVIDHLANRADWPQSSTFFYDNPQSRYHILNKSSSAVALASYASHQFRNFHLSITMQEIRSPKSGANYYGVTFRATTDQAHYYLFEVTPAQGGLYGFLRYDNGQWKLLVTGPIATFMTGPGKSNVITIDAKHNAFTFQVNGTPVRSPVADPSKNPLALGQIGLYVEEQGSEVAFSHLFIDSLP